MASQEQWARRMRKWTTARALLVTLGLSGLGGEVVLFVGVAPALAAPQSPQAQAKKLMARGKKLFAKGEFAQAEALFREGYALDPAPQFLFNIGKCQERQTDYLGALESYREFLVQLPEAKGRADLEVTMRTLEEKLAVTHCRLRVTSTPPAAELAIDGELQIAGTTPWSGWLPAGSYTVEVQAEGHEPYHKKLKAVAGKKLKLTATLEREGAAEQGETGDGGQPEAGGGEDAAAAGPGPGPGPESESSTSAAAAAGEGPTGAAAAGGKRASTSSTVRASPWQSPLVWTALGVGAAGLLAGGGLFLLAADKAEEAKDFGAIPGNSREAWQTLSDEADTRLLWSQVALGVGGAALAVGAGLVAWELLQGDEGTTKSKAGPKTALLPDVAPGVVGLSWTGSW